MVPHPRRSKVWKYFDKLDPNLVKCKICKKTIKYHSSTSNMKQHLKVRDHAHHIEPDDGNDSSYENDGSNRPSTSGTVSERYSNFGGEEKSVLSYQKLVVPISMRSVYWKCYGFPASADGEILTKVKIVCLLCKRVVSYNRNTSNLRLHLQNKHADELAQLELSKQSLPPRPPMTPKERRATAAKRKGNMYSTAVSGRVVLGNEDHQHESVNVSVSRIEDYGGTVTFNEHDTETEHDTPQVKVVNVYGSKPGNSSGKPHENIHGEQTSACTIESLHPFMIPIETSKTVCDAVAEFIIMDMQLPDIVEGRGFQRLIATLKSPCEIPSRNKLVDEVIPRAYDSYKESFQETLQSVKSDVALTVEEWESAAGETYVTFGICYQPEKEDTLTSKVLSTVHFYPTANSSTFWNTTLNNLITEWNIKIEKIKAVVSATTRQELINAMTERGLIVLPCLIQTLQDVCTKVCFEQDVVQEILCKCRTLIYIIYNTNTALAALRIQDHLMSLEEIPLTADNPKFWVSTYIMLEQLYARRQVIRTILDNVDETTYDREAVTITDHDWTLIEDLITVLEPFKVTMMTLSEEKSPLVSLLKPLLWQLLSSHLKIKEDESGNAQLFKTALKKLLSDKYTDPAVDQLLQSATILDPRFKSLQEEEYKEYLEGPIKEELVRLIEQRPEEEQEATPTTTEGPEKKKPRLLGMVMLLGDMCPTKAVSSNKMSHSDRASLELVQYQSEPSSPLDQCPVAWWNRTQTKFPNLAHLAAQYTCVPATAVPSAHIPFEAQLAYHSKRANLPAEIIDKIIFLNANHSM